MSVFSMLGLAVSILVGVHAIVAYNDLVNLKHSVSKAWANIDVLLKQRHDEIPKLVETCAFKIARLLKFASAEKADVDVRGPFTP